MFYHLIQQITDPQTGCRRNRNRIADSQIVKLIYVISKFCHAVHFIYSQHNRFSGFAEHICHLGIRIYQSLTHIYDKHDHICGGNGDLRLLPHLG